MTDQHRGEEIPDVEKIIAGIRQNVKDAEEAFEKANADIHAPALDQNAKATDNIYELLSAANRTTAVGHLPPEGGPKGYLRRRIYASIIPLIQELNQHHSQTVRFMNKLMRVLDGVDTEISSELLLNTQRLIDLMTQFCNRISQYDDLKIEERLKALEEKLRRLEK